MQEDKQAKEQAMVSTIDFGKTRRPRFKRGPKPLPLKLGLRHDQILRLVARYVYLDAYQVQRLLGLSRPATMALLSDLKHGGDNKNFYLRPVYQPFIFGSGSPRAIYILDHAGYSYLERGGCAPEGRFRPDELAHKELPFLEHILQTNSVLILAELLTRSQANISLMRVRSDRQLHRDPVKVEVKVGQKREKVAVIPDGYIDLDLSDGLEHCLAFEVDRDTAERKAIQTKIRAYLQYVQGAYQKAFGTQSLTVPFIVTEGGKGRVEDLLSWTEKALTEANLQKAAGLFRFSACNLAEITPEEFFLKPIWFTPFNRPAAEIVRIEHYQPVSLLGG